MIAATVLGGLLFLWVGGEAFVHGSVAVAERLNVSQLMIGLTLVAFGTSLPELVTSLTAVLEGAPGLSVGNVVGSNIVNVLLILGIAALIRPVTCRPDAFYQTAVALGIATAAATIMIVIGHLGRAHGLVLLAGLVVYLAVVYRKERIQPGPAGRVLVGEAQAAHPAPTTLPFALFLVVVGLAGVVGGAWMLVSGATELALIWGVSRTFMGLTIVAAGTSLPELVITSVASFRGRSDVALGNIMGSNIFNLLGILGITAIVTPINVPPALRVIDLAVMVAATALLIVVAATRMQVARWEGAGFLFAYVVFTIVRSIIAL